jgi:thiamine biosynthesis lipoprotein
MGTTVTIDAHDSEARERAFQWFREVEARCSRFDASSELRRIVPGNPTTVSTVLFEVIQFAQQVAEASGGAFDFTSGEHAHGEIVLDSEERTILLKRPLALDLGAVAKGLAVDAAARELVGDFAIDAGGDLYLGGLNPEGDRWSVGIRHPREPGAVVGRVQVSNQAVCTSGDYERGAHIIGADGDIASVTVIAPSAMLADAVGTAAFAMGVAAGLPFLETMQVRGVIVTRALAVHPTKGFAFAE